MLAFTEQEVKDIENFDDITDEQVSILKKKVYLNIREVIKSEINPNDFATKYDEIQMSVNEDMLSGQNGNKIYIFYKSILRYEMDINLDGTVNVIKEITKVDVESIKKN